MKSSKAFNEIIEQLIVYTQLIDLEAVGPIGELVAQLILLKVFDSSVKENYSEACTVESFLALKLFSLNNLVHYTHIFIWKKKA